MASVGPWGGGLGDHRPRSWFPSSPFRKTDPPRVGLDIDIDSFLRSDAGEEEEPEPPYRVLLHNDDVTPIDYVPTLLRRVFRIGRARALWLTLRAHVQVRAVVVVEARSKAQAHVSEAREAARRDGHPHLTLTLEPVE